MKIVFAASEMVPFAKTGGLGDVAGTLPNEIRLLGHEVLAFLPRYKSIDIKAWKLESVIDRLSVPLGNEKITVRIYRSRLKSGVEVYLIDAPDFFARESFYGTSSGDFPDNDRRFVLFQRAILETLRALGFAPDVIHSHDWQTGLLPTYVKTLYAHDALFRKTRTVFTIHNLGYQGNFPPDSLPTTGLEWEHFRYERLEFYGKVSFLKAGIVDADLLTTVSERYAKEIQSKEFGAGMEGALTRRKDTLFGVVNGIDTEEWNPETDTDIAAQFNFQKIDKKAVNKAALQKENGLEINPKAPVFGLVSRLVDQKGLDILIPAIEAILASGVQLVLLGTGEEKYHQVLRDLAKKKRGKIGVHILFDPKMAKRIYAGADALLIPSYYEPCGLGQMIACRFGTVPVVRATGGLADTVQDFNPKNGAGNGFVFDEYSSEALLVAINRAVEVYRDPKSWLQVVENAMNSDFSWRASAKKYIKLYEMTRRRALEGFSGK